MRVLVLHNAYREPGGEDSVVGAEVSLLRQGGHQVVVHQVTNPAASAQAARGMAQGIWNVGSARAVQALLSGEKFDVAHVHNTWFTLSPSVLRPLALAGLPIVVTLHNYRLLCLSASLHRDGHRCEECLGAAPWRGVVHRCYRGSGGQSLALGATVSAHRLMGTWRRYVDVFVAPSQLTRDKLAAGGLDPSRIVVKPNPVEDPGPRPHSPSHSTVVLFVGRLSREKGVDRLVQAWVDADTGMQLSLIGDGPLRADLEATQAGLDPARAEAVRLEGWLPADEVAGRMRSARALVLPTTMIETFGLAAVEGMAAGLPVLTTEGGALAEAVGDCGPAPVPVTGGSGAWTVALRGLLDDTCVDRWGEQSRQRYLERYSAEQALERLLDVYRRVGAGT